MKISSKRWTARDGKKEDKTVARRLAELADREGLTEEYAARREDLLRSVGISPEDVTADSILRAGRINRLAMRALRRRLGEKEEAAAAVDLRREEIFGFDVRLIAIWMGRDGWTFERAWPVLDHFNCDLSDDAIQRLLRDGREGRGREPAPLSPGQRDTLREISEKVADFLHEHVGKQRQ
jgi:hypothetical protein